jgi:hypothetical protein
VCATGEADLQHGELIAAELRKFLLEVMPVLEELVTIAPVKLVPIASRLAIVFLCAVSTSVVAL